MNGDIRRRIDTARDVLVGKIPDPKSQVEQITLALIYRFMDYMDRQSEEWGGSARFFTNGYEKYAWSNLVNPQIGGYERLDLYTEALVRMTQNPHLPQLFRDIFKNAFLPYRDPETLRLFLTEIDGFPLEHTEDLGDAYEYLLSVMSSQGDAGQFRTPRHIIDFIVRCIDPKKEDTILDPACGTAGFLICAYLHIMEQNAQDGRPGAALTVDEKAALVRRFSGYDISPDMVRLSLVNMYFHGFQSPSIHEYDTLGNEERWDETFDVMLANPPFMTPKGGIKPHKRFSVQANRSEVLFVDYIMEHLTPSGRAGVIVPEGIIFQSSNAYKNLRKMLVEDRYLYAVVSLPAGVFNPYAGVKTSILLMDRELAKRTDEILFVKVESDGYDLGAQRRAIEKNDLPDALEIVKAWKRHVADPSVPFTVENPKGAHAVPKSKIAASGDFNLSGDRYREVVAKVNQTWPMLAFADVCTLEYGDSLPEAKRIPGPYPVVGSNGVTGSHEAFLVEGPAIIVGRKGTAGAVVWVDEPCFPIDTTYYVKLTGKRDASLRFLYHVLSQAGLPGLRNGGGVPGLNRNDVYGTIRIPLPPMEVQEEIVAEIDAWQKVIDGAKQVVANYKPTIPVDPAWPIVELGKLCMFKSGGTPSKNVAAYWQGEIPWVSPKDMRVERISDTQDHISSTAIEESATTLVEPGALLIVVRSGILARSLPIAITSEPMAFNQDIKAVMSDSSQLLPEFLATALRQREKAILDQGVKKGATVHSLAAGFLEHLSVPLPPLEVQHQIVADIEEERKMIDANKRLIEIHEAKIKAKIAEVWGE